MEITTSPMTDRQRRYRATYRERIAGWYNGWLHVFVIYVIGLTALFIYGANIQSPRWWEWLIVPVTFLAPAQAAGQREARRAGRPVSSPTRPLPRHLRDR